MLIGKNVKKEFIVTRTVTAIVEAETEGEAIRKFIELEKKGMVESDLMVEAEE